MTKDERELLVRTSQAVIGMLEGMAGLVVSPKLSTQTGKIINGLDDLVRRVKQEASDGS